MYSLIVISDACSSVICFLPHSHLSITCSIFGTSLITGASSSLLTALESALGFSLGNSGCFNSASCFFSISELALSDFVSGWNCFPSGVNTGFLSAVCPCVFGVLTNDSGFAKFNSLAISI